MKQSIAFLILISLCLCAATACESNSDSDKKKVEDNAGDGEVTGDGGASGDGDVTGDGDITEPDKTINERKFMVAADTHYFDPALGTSGEAFQEYLDNDRKLIAESDALMHAFSDIVVASDASFLIIPGDLTKDGEQQSHEKVAAYLKTIEESGTEVYVIPGNHDINNGEAEKYDGANTAYVDNVTPEEFCLIYDSFGYAEALEKDDNSLSYVVEPVEGIWLIAMDSCIYDSNKEGEHPTTAGQFSEATQTWIEEKIAEGKSKDKIVLGFMHHGLVEHYTGQSELFSEYVVADWENVSESFAKKGMKAVFTGHYHAQDITKRDIDDSTSIYDIETGSLVTAPCPYREIEWTADNKLDIKTGLVEEIDYDLGDEYSEFGSYASDFLTLGLVKLVPEYLAGALAKADYDAFLATVAAGTPDYTLLANFIDTDGDSVPDSPDMTYYLPVAQSLAATELVEGVTVSDMLVDAFCAHYKGIDDLDFLADAKKAQYEAIISAMQGSGNASQKMLGNFIGSLWTDLDVEDQDVVIDLAD